MVQQTVHIITRTVRCTVDMNLKYKRKKYLI